MNIENGNKVWRNSSGQFHREDGPAIERTDGSKEWWMNNHLHRTDGPARESASGTKEWWIEGKLHRTDGPAIEWSKGTKEWWVNGQLHRMDGPAFEFSNGGKEWYFRNKKVSKSDVEILGCQLNLKVLLLSRTVNPFCEINVVKYTL
jgi:hypothetical protein